MTYLNNKNVQCSRKSLVKNNFTPRQKLITPSLDKPLPTLAHKGKDRKKFTTFYSSLRLIQPAYL